MSLYLLFKISIYTVMLLKLLIMYCYIVILFANFTFKSYFQVYFV